MFDRRKWQTGPDFSCQHQHKGFTLIEVLIAIVILSIGLLGVAAMQIRALQYNHDAYLRSQITNLATDISERIRLNRENAADYVSTYVLDTLPTGCTTATGTNATNDLACWRLSAFTALPPGGSADISSDAGLYTVTLSWIDRGTTERTIDYTFLP